MLKPIDAQMFHTGDFAATGTSFTEIHDLGANREFGGLGLAVEVSIDVRLFTIYGVGSMFARLQQSMTPDHLTGSWTDISENVEFTEVGCVKINARVTQRALRLLLTPTNAWGYFTWQINLR